MAKNRRQRVERRFWRESNMMALITGHRGAYGVRALVSGVWAQSELTFETLSEVSDYLEGLADNVKALSREAVA